ncbi:MAG: hypothetical protein SGILL_003291, partial [Bacillariaceae sp.]
SVKLAVVGGRHIENGDDAAFSSVTSTRHLVVIGETPGPGAGVVAVADGAYQPQTDILDQQRIGFDQEELVEHLDTFLFEEAFDMYQEGGHSAAVASINLETPLPTEVQRRSIVLGTSEAGENIRAEVQEDIAALSTLMDVFYPVSKGGPHFSYDALENTKNARTLQGMAADDSLFKDCLNCPLETSLKFINFYGVFSYANDLILAAFQQSTTNFVAGNADFSQMSDEGRAEVIQRLTLNLVVWMYAVGKMETGIQKCLAQDPTDNGVANWDSAIAFYVGMETNSTGLLFGLSDELCPSFETCDEAGRSAVNREVLAEFAAGQGKLAKGQCEDVVGVKNRIVSLMTIPLVQGTLYYSYWLRGTQDERILGAAYGFTAAILPLLNDCDSDGVGIISISTSIPPPIDAGGVDLFPLVKGFIEAQYECLGIKCQDVGTLDGAELCSERENDDVLDDDVISDDDASSARGDDVLLGMARIGATAALLLLL